MKKKIILGTSFIILLFSFLIFLYFKSSYDEKLIEKKKKLELVEKENKELLEERIES